MIPLGPLPGLLFLETTSCLNADLKIILSLIRRSSDTRTIVHTRLERLLRPEVLNHRSVYFDDWWWYPVCSSLRRLWTDILNTQNFVCFAKTSVSIETEVFCEQFFSATKTILSTCCLMPLAPDSVYPYTFSFQLSSSLFPQPLVILRIL